MKRIIITESQLKHIIGENTFSYNTDTNSNKQSDLSYSDETNTKQTDKNGDRYGSPDSDKIGKEIAKRYPFGTVTTNRHINEENSELQDNFICNGKNIPTGTINYWKNREKNGEKLTSTQKKMINRVDGQRNGIKGFKEIKKELGDNNAFLKSHTKTSGNGKAHTPKGNITYEY